MIQQPILALMSAMDLPPAQDGQTVAAWIHLLPKPVNGQIETADGRGPYQVVGSLVEIIAASFERTDKIEIDINHATYIAAPLGMRSDAVGWIIEMEARDDGIWGRVEWTKEGAGLVSDKAYRAISPVLMISAADKKTIQAIGNASLVNRPNLRGLTVLNQAAPNQENPMSFMVQVCERLGLKPDASEADILAVLPATTAVAVVALQSAMAEIAATFGVEVSNPLAIVAAAKVNATQADTLAALQAENATLRAQNSGAELANARAASEAYVDGQVAAKRAIRAQDREWFITLHMTQPEVARRSIKALPMLADIGKAAQKPPTADTLASLNVEELQAAKALGRTPQDLAALLAADRKARNLNIGEPL